MGLKRLVPSLFGNLIKHKFFRCLRVQKCYSRTTTTHIEKHEKYFPAAIFPHFCVLFSLFFTEFRFSCAIVVVIVFIVCLRIYLCVCICHTYKRNHTYIRIHIHIHVLCFFCFLTCMSQFVCLEFYYTEKSVFSFILFHFWFLFCSAEQRKWRRRIQPLFNIQYALSGEMEKLCILNAGCEGGGSMCQSSLPRWCGIEK